MRPCVSGDWGRCVVSKPAASLTPAPAPPAEQAARVALDSANRWTDNVFTLQSWSKKKFAGMEGQLDGFFKQVSSFPGAQVEDDGSTGFSLLHTRLLSFFLCSMAWTRTLIT